MGKNIICSSCSAENLPKARFCHNCGKSLIGVRGKIGAFKQKIEYQAHEKLGQIKNSVDIRIKDYLNRLENSEEIKLGNIRIPESKRDNIRNALVSFQERIGGSTQIETSEEFQQWLDDLPSRLEEQKCIVCFVNWTFDDDIVVCKYCQSGGHHSHLMNWIGTNHICPLCRKTITSRDLIPVNLTK